MAGLQRRMDGETSDCGREARIMHPVIPAALNNRRAGQAGMTSP